MVKLWEVVGKNVVSYREAKGWSQADFARKLKTSRSTIHRIETGRGGINPSTLTKICNLLGIEEVQLIRTEDAEVELVNHLLNQLPTGELLPRLKADIDLITATTSISPLKKDILLLIAGMAESQSELVATKMLTPIKGEAIRVLATLNDPQLKAILPTLENLSRKAAVADPNQLKQAKNIK
jgi:transcriptional regulator with XRE-family HTH domain